MTQERNIKSRDYRDYVIKNGRFIGAFEEMYQNIEDPWSQGDATAIQYDLILLLVRRYNLNKKYCTILDIGCGKGAFTSRLKAALPLSSILGLDISPTAVQHARDTYGGPGIGFETLDIRKQYRTIQQTYDVIIISQVIWYVLPNLKEILDHLVDYALKPDGYLIISQAFYQPGEQTYGKEIIASLEDLMRFIKIPVVELIESNRFSNHDAIIILQKKSM